LFLLYTADGPDGMLYEFKKKQAGWSWLDYLVRLALLPWCFPSLGRSSIILSAAMCREVTRCYG
jgi:hypothetical protein